MNTEWYGKTPIYWFPMHLVPGVPDSLFFPKKREKRICVYVFHGSICQCITMHITCHRKQFLEFQFQMFESKTRIAPGLFGPRRTLKISIYVYNKYQSQNAKRASSQKRHMVISIFLLCNSLILKSIGAGSIRAIKGGLDKVFKIRDRLHRICRQILR